MILCIRASEWRWKRTAGVFAEAVVAASALLLFTPACTALLDRSAAQCHTDDDCAHFGGHPYCQTASMQPCQGAGNCVCVPSKLAPTNCFFGTPLSADDFLNQCSFGYLPGDPSSTSPLGQCLAYTAPTNPDAGLQTPIPLPPASPGDAGVSAAPVPCNSVAPPGGSVLYMSGSSNFPPLLEKLAPAISISLAAQGLPPITPVFKTTSSCAGVQSVYPDQTKAATTPPTYAAGHTIHDPTSATDSYPQYFDPTTLQLTSCSLGPSGAPVDIGESEIFPETCGLTRDDVDVSETLGPNLAILFVAPAETNQKVISSEAAREVFGGGGLAPWTLDQLFYVRGAGTATQQLIGHEIGVPSNAFWGIDQGTAQALATNLGAILSPSVATQAIGILGADFYDGNTVKLKALAFQATGQDCAYTPDSNSNSPVAPRDKLNVRDGHYPIWGPVHLLNVKVSGQATSTVTNFASLFGAPTLPVEMLDAFIDASFVPDCAMMVQRESELGPLTSAAPVVSCGCHFDSHVNPNPSFVPPGCTTCMSNDDCKDPTKPECLYGFCEVASQ